MKLYVSSKIVQAEPCERDGAPGYRVRYPDGYESWSPAEAFETSSREIKATELLLIDQAR